MKYLLYIVFFSTLMVLFSCETCGIAVEPTVSVTLPQSINSNITKITIVGSNKDWENLNAIDYELPLNLNADHTTYVFTQLNRTDTLTIYYKRKIYNASKQCSYIIDLEQPDMPNPVKSTFKDVQYRYSSYYGRVRGLSQMGGEGIYVYISQL